MVGIRSIRHAWSIVGGQLGTQAALGQRSNCERLRRRGWRGAGLDDRVISRVVVFAGFQCDRVGRDPLIQARLVS